MKIIRAGLLAPYAAQAVAGQDFRRFFVFQAGSPQLAHVAALGKRQVKRRNSCAMTWRLILRKTKPRGL